jgi:Flp pilus assembly protein TadD
MNMDNVPTKHSSFWICLALTFATTAVFWQVCTYDFVNYDDPLYIYENPNIQAGITLKTIKWAFTTGYANFWHPLTWLSHMLDWQLFGSNPAGHHLVNLIFHIANTLLVFLVLKRMTGALWSSAFVAALFALHPLHVESVAWVAERKDVLSIFFWLLTMWAYIRYVKQSSVANYLLTLLVFALGLMAKPMLVTLPFVLLLLDYWPLARIPQGQEKKHTDTRFHRLYPLILEKIPFIVLSAVFSVIAFLVQRSGEAVAPLTALPIKLRIYNALISYVEYIEKMIWPSRLAMFYPHPSQNVSVLYAIISAALLLSVTILILRFAKERRYLVTGWLWYLGTLVPVIGFVQVGEHAMADRYSYITLTGLFIIIAWGLPELLEKWPHRKIMLWASSLIVLSALAICAHLQQRYWKNTLTLCEHALKVTDNNYEAHFCMMDMLLKQGRIEEAIWHNTEALRINPYYLDAITGLGTALYEAGRIDEAIYYYERALKMNSRFAPAHANLAVALIAEGKFAEAVRHCRIALATMDIIPIHSTLGYALLKLGRFEEAVAEYRKVLLAMPNDPDVLSKLGYALAHIGEFDEATLLYNKALQIAPDLVDVRLNLGFALTESGKLEEAVKEYEKILLIQPQNAVAHNDLGAVLFRQGKLDETIEHFSQAVRIDPNYTTARDNLNLALAEKQKPRNKTTENTKE